MKNSILIVTAILILAGCGGGTETSSYTYDNGSNSYESYPPSTKVVNIDKKNQIVKIKKSSDTTVKLNIDSPKDIYVLVTSHFDNQDISINSSRRYNKIVNKKANKKYKFSKTPQKVLNFNKNIDKFLNIKVSKNSLTLTKHKKIYKGDEFSFCTDMDISNYCTEYVNATAQKVVRNINTKYGKKNLIIWVANGEYDDGYNYGSINQEKVDKLADIFLKNSDNNQYDDDIYDWDTNVLGEEWGRDAQIINQNLIGESDTINLLIYDMHTDELAGYFWAKDNFKSSVIPASNEKIMFYVNSQMYEENEEETFSTLAHEFQHMIHFYQRNILNGLEDDAWFDEMMSETTEDLVATKLKCNGPRNVDYNDGSAGYKGNDEGRYPYFNERDTRSLTTWYNDIYDYAKVSSFGTFLLRNYGGAKLLHNLMFSPYKNEKAILNATGKSDFKDLINEWGEAVILSDKDNLDSSKPRYNFGDFLNTTYNGITYKLGSINFFNYIPTPQMSNRKTVNENGNLYYKVGENLSGNINIKVNMQYGGDVIVIAK